MLSIKLLSNVEVFSLLFMFFCSLTLLFLLAFRGLYCFPAFEIDLLYIILCHVFFTFFISCTNIHRALVLWNCGAMNFQDSQPYLLSFSLMTVRFFAWRSLIWWGLAMSKNGHLPHLWHYSPLPPRKKQISGCHYS